LRISFGARIRVGAETIQLTGISKLLIIIIGKLLMAGGYTLQVGNTAKTKEELDHFVFNVLPSKFNISQ
jgi:hypothetical protein